MNESSSLCTQHRPTVRQLINITGMKNIARIYFNQTTDCVQH